MAQNILDSSLIAGLKKSTTIPPATIIHTGATELRDIVSKAELQVVLVAYNRAIRNVFVVCICLACLSFVGAITLEWRSVKGKQGPTAKKVDDEEHVSKKYAGEDDVTRDEPK